MYTSYHTWCLYTLYPTLCSSAIPFFTILQPGKSFCLSNRPGSHQGVCMKRSYSKDLFFSDNLAIFSAQISPSQVNFPEQCTHPPSCSITFPDPTLLKLHSLRFLCIVNYHVSPGAKISPQPLSRLQRYLLTFMYGVIILKKQMTYLKIYLKSISLFFLLLEKFAAWVFIQDIFIISIHVVLCLLL